MEDHNTATFPSKKLVIFPSKLVLACKLQVYTLDASSVFPSIFLCPRYYFKIWDDPLCIALMEILCDSVNLLDMSFAACFFIWSHVFKSHWRVFSACSRWFISQMGSGIDLSFQYLFWSQHWLISCGCRYYSLDAYHNRKMEKEIKKGMAKVLESERTIFNDEEQRRFFFKKIFFVQNFIISDCYYL